MSEPEPATGEQDRRPALVFISYATADRAEALKVCNALERRGTRCWISMRDVPPGANYQEAIVQSLRTARAMVLVFSDAANNSDEIKKELSLASRYQVPVMALRLQDVEPGDAFAYELSTRQWINAFEGWDKSIETLIARIAQFSGSGPAVSAAAAPAFRRKASFPKRVMPIAAAGLIALVAVGAWWALRPSPASAHSMAVRLVGFKPLSADLPASLTDAVDAEITAAFNKDGVVGIASAPAATKSSAPDFTLGGTIQRDAEGIRVITSMVNGSSGATVWSETYNYESDASRVPRRIAVDAGNVVRCGLFGASTYDKPLPDAVLRDYMQFCRGHWDTNSRDGRLTLVPAQRVVAAVPDFSWGWAAVAGGYWKVAGTADNASSAREARASGREAADRAIALDSRNSEALYIKAVLTSPLDWIGREDLFKRAVAARRLDCGCEYHQYGMLLLGTGRIAEALTHLRQANAMLALYLFTPQSLAEALVIAGKPKEARTPFDAAIDLATPASSANRLATYEAMLVGDVDRLLDPALRLPEEMRAALVQGYRAKMSGDSAARARAVQALLALPENRQNTAVTWLVGDLGANQEAFQLAARLTATAGPSLLWHPGLRGALADPGFPELAAKLGLLDYWKKSQTKPDVCSEGSPPPFCQML